MPDTMTIGLWLFYLGAGVAYIGTARLPWMAKSLKATLWTLVLTAASGWAAMFAAAIFTGYGQTWLDMPAAYLTGGLTVLAGLASTINGPEEEEEQ